MTDLRQAAQQALDVLLTTQAINAPSLQIQEAIAVLRAALTQPEPQPAIYPEEAREMGLEEMAFYTHPPVREWQGLSPGELQSVMSTHFGGHEITDDEAYSAEKFASAIEAALKERNA